jgi:hypothetical protein
VLYILILTGIGMVRHPDLTAIPAVVILTLFAAVLGGVSGTVLGVLNGVLVAALAIPLMRPLRSRSDEGQTVLLVIVGVIAAAVNAIAVRAVLNWWLSGGTITFVQFPLAFGWVCAVVTDLRVTRRLHEVQGRQQG